jgi:hypothetical protein
VFAFLGFDHWRRSSVLREILMFNVRSRAFRLFILALTVVLILWASGGIQSAYNTIENAATPLTKRTIANFTGTGVNCVDNAGATRTDCTINGTGVANFAQAFVGQTTVTMTHNLGTTSVLTQCVDNGTPPNVIIPQNIAITSANVVTVTFSSSQSGTCIVNGAAAGTATSVPFSGITTATNSTATMTCGTGCTVNRSGSGVVDANQVNSGTIPANATLTGTNGSNQFISQTAAVATAFLNLFTSTLQGLVPASGGGTVNFLRADGTFAAPPGSTGGGLVLGIVTKTTTYTFTPNDYAVDADATGGTFTVNLEAAPVTGQIHVLAKSTAPNTVNLSGNGKNINGSTPLALTVQYTSYTVQYNGTEWRIE